MSQKTGYAKYTIAFASDIQKLADEKHIKVTHFQTSERKSKRGSYDYLTVSFVVPRPDRDEPPKKSLEDHIYELEAELEKDNEVNNDEI
jgi:hypothetical protein